MTSTLNLPVMYFFYNYKTKQNKKCNRKVYALSAFAMSFHATAIQGRESYRARIVHAVWVTREDALSDN